MLNGLFYYDDECVGPVVRELNANAEDARFTIFMDKTRKKLIYGERTFKDVMQLIPSEIQFELAGYRTEEEMLRDLQLVLQDNYTVEEIRCRTNAAHSREMAGSLGR